MPASAVPAGYTTIHTHQFWAETHVGRVVQLPAGERATVVGYVVDQGLLASAFGSFQDPVLLQLDRTSVPGQLPSNWVRKTGLIAGYTTLPGYTPLPPGELYTYESFVDLQDLLMAEERPKALPVAPDLSAFPSPCGRCGMPNAVYQGAFSVQVREHGCSAAGRG